MNSFIHSSIHAPTICQALFKIQICPQTKHKISCPGGAYVPVKGDGHEQIKCGKKVKHGQRVSKLLMLLLENLTME
jgi:hypothetical protein